MFGRRDDQLPNITPAELAQELRDAQPPFLLDVRTPGEYADGHIPHAHLLPLARLEGEAGTLPADRRIVCVCHSGRRSEVATRFLRTRGLEARNLSGGMLAWRGTVIAGTSPKP